MKLTPELRAQLIATLAETHPHVQSDAWSIADSRMRSPLGIILDIKTKTGAPIRFRARILNGSTEVAFFAANVCFSVRPLAQPSLEVDAQEASFIRSLAACAADDGELTSRVYLGDLYHPMVKGGHTTEIQDLILGLITKGLVGQHGQGLMGRVWLTPMGLDYHIQAVRERFKVAEQMERDRPHDDMEPRNHGPLNLIPHAEDYLKGD